MMNRDSSDKSDKSEIEVIVNLVCREFELKFREDPGFRIEDLLDEVRQRFNRFKSDVDHTKAKNQAVAELIFVEMELRWRAGQLFDASEYLSRFPDFGPAIEDSLNRLLRLHSSFRETCFLVNVRAEDGGRDDEIAVQLQHDSLLEPGIPEALGRFREISQIKSGSFGIVCRAIDSHDGRVVALKFPRKDKLLHDPDLKMFLAEASKAMKLNHPGIVRTFSIEKSNGYLAIVQQFIEGSDLTASRDQLRSQKEIARLVANITDAVAYAHQQGIYHRDLKPANILMDRQGRPYVADFGLAINESEQIYLPRQRCGTAYYMPPEQVAGLTRLVDGRSDIWSLGVMLYELLTKQRPFRGVTDPDIFDQIENKDPRPPRQIDDSIDPELQRICLKCLERQQRDRYLTADELADDLRHWAGLPNHKIKPAGMPAPFMPKGLRSYSAEDAPFFLDLLPGPRDRDGAPSSIRFWESRICEPVAAPNRVPVGVIFGPSGSGKSSFIKAGLLSQLGDDVMTVYVEATQVDTEVRLLKAIRQRLDGIPDEISLPEMFRGLSRGQWRPSSSNKLLIVIDQFEQRLSRGDDFASSQLARAMRFCDGQQLQCLLLTRDDFMMALSRFVDALEMDIREGENAQAIDLFDRKHARKVLAKLGRAYDQLPAESATLSAEQESFLDEAVKQLADDDHVICVHLALFAEMFRHRPWTPTELKLVGGVAGTGEKFLETTFGPGSRDKRHRMQRESAQRVLETLLPAAGTDIRGAMKSEQELIAAAKLQNQPDQFDELIKSLDGQLRLITRTDPDLPHDVELKKADASNQIGWYQLTHDYLVPSVRSWLDRSLGMTRAGRARLRLRDLGAQVIPGQPPRNLPTNLEWLAWQFQIPSSGLAVNERTVMRAAGRRFQRQAMVAVAILLLVGTLAVYGLYQNAYQQRLRDVDALIGKLINQDVSTTPQIAKDLAAQRSIAEPRLRVIVDDPTRLPREHLRALMGLVHFDPDRAPTLIDAITRPECTPDELVAMTAILRGSGFRDEQQLSQTFTDTEASPRSRFRALCATVRLHDDQKDLTQYAGLIANVLWHEPVTTMDRWIEIMQPVGKQLATTFLDIFAETEDMNNAFVLAKALFVYLNPSDRNAQFAAIIGSANESQFDAILSTSEENGAGNSLAEEFQKRMQGNIDGAAQTNTSIALARLGHDEQLVARYSGSLDSNSTILAINFSTARRLRLHNLRQLYEKHSLETSADVNLRRSILQALALQSVDVFDPALRAWLERIARRHVVDDPDACCFSSSELILSRLEIDTAELRQARRNKSDSRVGIWGNVLIDPQGQAFSIIEYRDEGGQSANFAISTTEVTNLQVHEFKESLKTGGTILNPKLPFEIRNPEDFRMIFYFCNWLSAQNGLGEELCYPTEVPMEQIALTAAGDQGTGYRLPTVEEWTIANESNRVLEGMKAGSDSIALNYAWLNENTGGQVRDVSTRLPNANGIFDSFGNLKEIAQWKKGKELEYYELGQAVIQFSSALSLNYRNYHDAGSTFKLKVGFRVVRSLR